jgi:O-antigen/teichoic acid export membrane protein
LKSFLAGLLIWIVPLLLTEFNALRFETFPPWHSLYLIILLLAIIYGIAIFVSFQFLGRFKHGRIVETLVIAAFLFIVFSIFGLSVRLITDGYWSVLLSGPVGIFVGVVMGLALGRVHSQLLSEPMDSRNLDMFKQSPD